MSLSGGGKRSYLPSSTHAHIAAIYSLDEHEGTQYLAMELVEGETPEQKLKKDPLPIQDTLSRLEYGDDAAGLDPRHGRVHEP